MPLTQGGSVSGQVKFLHRPTLRIIELNPNIPSPKRVAYNKEKGIHCTGYFCLGSTNSPLCKDPTLLKLAEKSTTPEMGGAHVGNTEGVECRPQVCHKGRIEKNFELDGWVFVFGEVHLEQSEGPVQDLRR